MDNFEFSKPVYNIISIFEFNLINTKEMGPRKGNRKGVQATINKAKLVPSTVYQTGFDPDSSLRSAEKRKRDDDEPPVDDDEPPVELTGLGNDFDEESDDIPDSVSVQPNQNSGAFSDIDMNKSFNSSTPSTISSTSSIRLTTTAEKRKRNKVIILEDAVEYNDLTIGKALE